MIERVYSALGQTTFLADRICTVGAQASDAEIWESLFSVLRRPGPLDGVMLAGWSRAVLCLLEAGRLGPAPGSMAMNSFG